MQLARVKSIKKISSNSKLYDIKVSQFENFFANNILVHNCTSMYRDNIHARSLDSLDHPSRHHVKKLHGEIQYDIPENFRICGENVFAKHSVHYKNLESYFYVFGIYDDKNICVSWDETVEFANLLGLMTVPVLYKGIWDEEKVKACWTGNSTASPGDEQEGYVIRIADSFPYDQQDNDLNSIFTAKMVREKHVKTSIHWMTEKIIPNLLRNPT